MLVYKMYNFEELYDAVMFYILYSTASGQEL